MSYVAPPAVGDPQVYTVVRLHGLSWREEAQHYVALLRSQAAPQVLVIPLSDPTASLIVDLLRARLRHSDAARQPVGPWAANPYLTPSPAWDRAVLALPTYPRTWLWRFQTVFRLRIEAMHIAAAAAGQLQAGVTIRQRQHPLDLQLALLLALRDRVPIDVSDAVLDRLGEPWPLPGHPVVTAEHATALAAPQAEPTHKGPPMLATIMLHNDDTTPMDHVVAVLTTICQLDEPTAIQIMQAAHTAGTAVVRHLPADAATALVVQVQDYVQQQGLALQITCILPTAEEDT